LTITASTIRPRSINRFVGLGIVGLIHVGLVYALITGLAYRVVQIAPVAIETKIIQETQPQRRQPPPPTPNFAVPPPPFVPPPEVHLEKPPPPPVQSTAITEVTHIRPPEPASPQHQPLMVLPHINLAASHEPEYPPASRRLGEQGTAILEVLVEASGRPVDVKVVQSSGFPRLDAAAIAGVKENYRFFPGTVDGKPQAMRYTFKFTWTLR
jgi:periplasmic protein TonB